MEDIEERRNTHRGCECVTECMEVRRAIGGTVDASNAQKTGRKVWGNEWKISVD
jgi:hypothetical protein